MLEHIKLVLDTNSPILQKHHEYIVNLILTELEAEGMLPPNIPYDKVSKTEPYRMSDFCPDCLANNKWEPENE
jgi:hypothetical protein